MVRNVSNHFSSFFQLNMASSITQNVYCEVSFTSYCWDTLSLKNESVLNQLNIYIYSYPSKYCQPRISSMPTFFFFNTKFFHQLVINRKLNARNSSLEAWTLQSQTRPHPWVSASGRNLILIPSIAPDSHRACRLAPEVTHFPVMFYS